MTIAHHYLPGIELGPHKEIAGVLVVLLPIGLGTGLYLYFKPGLRKVLPALHAINNLIVLILLLAQITTGLSVYRAFVPH